MGQGKKRAPAMAQGKKQAAEPTFAPKRAVSPKTNTGQIQFYSVEVGDTLSKISVKVYGSGVEWEKIYNANKDSLRNAHDLKVGQVLKIPRP